jgi:hypothetical protein
VSVSIYVLQVFKLQSEYQCFCEICFHQILEPGPSHRIGGHNHFDCHRSITSMATSSLTSAPTWCQASFVAQTNLSTAYSHRVGRHKLATWGATTGQIGSPHQCLAEFAAGNPQHCVAETPYLTRRRWMKGSSPKGKGPTAAVRCVGFAQQPPLAAAREEVGASGGHG